MLVAHYTGLAAEMHMSDWHAILAGGRFETSETRAFAPTSGALGVIGRDAGSGERYSDSEKNRIGIFCG